MIVSQSHLKVVSHDWYSLKSFQIRIEKLLFFIFFQYPLPKLFEIVLLYFHIINFKMENDFFTQLKLQSEANQLCFDCGEPDPKWASTNNGIFLCL
jgi:hypothetical protein